MIIFFLTIMIIMIVIQRASNKRHVHTRGHFHAIFIYEPFFPLLPLFFHQHIYYKQLYLLFSVFSIKETLTSMPTSLCFPCFLVFSQTGKELVIGFTSYKPVFSVFCVFQQTGPSSHTYQSLFSLFSMFSLKTGEASYRLYPHTHCFLCFHCFLRKQESPL